MILLDSKSKDFHHILWRFNKQDPISIYQLQTVTYGSRTAPFLACNTLNTIGKQISDIDIEIGIIIIHDFYVDDLITGGNSIYEAKIIQEKSSSTLKDNGFYLRKWISNCSAILENIPKNDLAQAGIDLQDKSSTFHKSLGLKWCPISDTLLFEYTIENQKTWSKRNLLKDLGKVYDPLGLICPITTTFKMIFQEFWIN
ncbi:unnamed protein product, partial [Rotaria socialis]